MMAGNTLPLARIGLISDTHGMLRPEAVQALRGSDHIIHAGDVGNLSILDALAKIAPVTAVRGNIDKGVELPETAAVGQIYVLHDIHTLDLDPAAAGFRAVVTGHSHKPGSFKRTGVLYVNPGAAGPRRFRLPVSVARLDTGSWSVEFVTLG